MAKEIKKVNETTLHYKHEFHFDRISHGKAYITRAGAPIRVHKSWEKTDSEFLGWMDRRVAKLLAKKSGWLFEDG